MKMATALSSTSLVLALIGLVNTIAIAGLKQPELLYLNLGMLLMLVLVGVGVFLGWQAGMIAINLGKFEFRNGPFMKFRQKMFIRISFFGLCASLFCLGLAAISLGILTFMVSAADVLAMV